MKINTKEKKVLFNQFRILALLILIISVCGLNAQHLAFPGAEGYGRFAEGGRGGEVYIVTNLNDDGPGSLRYGLDNLNDHTTIIFEVSGTIELTSSIELENDYVTIAGESAPGDGICIANHTFKINECSHAIIRYIRVRLGPYGGSTGGDVIGITNVNDVILDHVTATWGVDGTMDTKYLVNFTLQWSMFGQALHNSIHYEGSPHAMLMSLRSTTGPTSLHHNLFFSSRNRHPTLDGEFASSIFDFRNNIVYNRDGPTNIGIGKFNLINNYYRPGSSTEEGSYQMIPKLKTPNVTTGYMEGTIFEGDTERTNDNYSAMNWGSYFYSETVLREDFVLPEQLVSPEDRPYTHSASDAYDVVLQNAGASLSRDSNDIFVVQGVKDRTNRLIDHPDDVGGFPVLEEITHGSEFDTDRDGMPNEWELSNGLDTNDAADRNNDRNYDGYTNLEEYLHSLVTNLADAKPIVSVIGTENEKGGFIANDDIPLKVYAVDYNGGRIEKVELFLDDDVNPIISVNEKMIDTVLKQNVHNFNLGSHYFIAKATDDSGNIAFDTSEFIVGSSYDTITIDTTGTGTVSMNPPGGIYVNGMQVSIMAKSEFPAIFSDWIGDVNVHTNPLLITIDSNISLTANFVIDTSSFININFQPEGSEIPTGYLADYGYEYGDRGDGYKYGWVGSNNFETRERSGEPDLKIATLNHMQKDGYANWEIELDNGNYAVYMHMGDPEHTDNINSAKIESMDVTDEDGEDNFDDYYLDKVQVSDGKLTIAPTGENAKINYIRFKLIGEAFDSYQLSVEDGLGSGNYIAGYVVDIMANDSADFSFERWSGDTAYIDDVYGKSTKLTMAASNISVKAEYSLIKYTLTVSNGNGSGEYGSGDVISITANAPDSGQVFDKWTGDVTDVADVNDDRTTIEIQADDIAVTASYKAEYIISDTNIINDTNTTNIANNVINELQVYPNPAGSNFTIDLNKIENAEIEIYDMYGKLAFNIISNESVIFINNHNLKNGIYYIKVTDSSKNVYSQKLIIE